MKRKNLLKKILCGVLVAFVIFLACIGIIWKNEILSINSIKVVQEADEGHHDGYIYQMNYYGDYYFDEFIEQGGVSSDKELTSFIVEKMSKGIGDLNMDIKNVACSSFTAQGENGARYFARNYDMNKPGSLCIVHTKPGNGRYASVSTVDLNFVGVEPMKKAQLKKVLFVTAPYLPLDGLNEAGVACAVYTSQQGTGRNPTNQNTDKPDITTTTLIRMILDYAGSVDEAVELAQRYDMHDSSNCSYHIMVADATGKSAVLEWINDKSLKDKKGEDRKLNVLYNAESFQVITNYILAPNYYSTRREMVGFSRFNKIQQALEERHGIVKDENEAMDILKLVCRRQEKNGKSNTYTVHSVVYNLTEGLALFVGNEHYNEGREITYAIKDKSNNNLKEKPNEVMEKSQTDKPEVIGNEVNGENEMIELKEKIEAYTSGLEGYKISMAIIGEHGEDTLFYDSDTKTFSNEVPRYVYEIGSITKTFTAGLLCKEIAEGEIQLNDNLKQFYPEDLIEEHYPTVLQLATHTSGLSNDLNVATKEGEEALNKRMEGFSGDYEGDCIYSYLREEDLIENIMSIQFDKDEYPYDYSNIGYATLGNILGVAGGASYDELMNHFISEELELKETTLDMPKSSSPLKDKVLKGIGKKGSPNGNWIWGESGAKATGAIYSTLNDMIKYVKIYMDGEKDYLKMAHDQVYAKSATNNFDLGLAWVKEGNITWHNGGTGCFRSFVGFREDKRLGAIILTNGYGKSSQTNVDQIGKSILMEEYHIE